MNALYQPSQWNLSGIYSCMKHKTFFFSGGYGKKNVTGDKALALLDELQIKKQKGLDVQEFLQSSNTDHLTKTCN